MKPLLRLLIVATSVAPLARSDAQAQRAAVIPCVADSNVQRLAFWVGDWDVLDSAGAPYATQRVHPAVDGCALTVEWTGNRGSKGLSIYAFDRRASDWKQVYVANQVPTPIGVQLRKSDPTYTGPGIRFIALFDPAPEMLNRSRVTIMPLADHRAVQLFEDSRDGGKTWTVTFRGEHRALRP